MIFIANQIGDPRKFILTKQSQRLDRPTFNKLTCWAVCVCACPHTGVLINKRVLHTTGSGGWGGDIAGHVSGGASSVPPASGAEVVGLAPPAR